MITKLTKELDCLLALPEPGESVGRLNVIQLQCKLTVLQTSDDDILALCDLS